MAKRGSRARQAQLRRRPDRGHHPAGEPRRQQPQAIVTGQAAPFGIAVDASHIYWTNSGDGTIWRANLDRTNAQSIVQDEGRNSLFAVAVDANHLYWTNRSQGMVKRANLDGTNPEVFILNTGGPQLMVAVPPAPAKLGFTPSPYNFGTYVPGSQTVRAEARPLPMYVRKCPRGELPCTYMPAITGELVLVGQRRPGARTCGSGGRGPGMWRRWR